MGKSMFLPVLLLLFCLSSTAQSLRFNGSSNYVNIGNGASLHLETFTLEAWINIQGTGSTTGTSQGNEGGFKASTVVPLITKGRREKGGTSTAINYFFGYQASDRRLVADFEDKASGAHHTIVGNASLATSNWVHVAVTYGANAWKLYINGALDKSGTFSGTVIPQSASNVSAAIASSLNSGGSAEGYFNGMIDEVRIWNVVRAASEISAYMNSELSTGTGLVARYGFNEGSGSTAANSVAGNTTGAGRLINSPQWTLGFNQTAPTNNAPVLAAIGNQTAIVGQALTFTATASDPDAGQTLTYSLVGAPSDASINASTGAFSWTPAATGTYTFTVRVTDNGSPALSDDEQISVTVNQPATTNNAPVLGPIGNKSVTLGQTLTFTATASDPDAGQTLTFSLINSPNDASINASTGAFTWVPTTSGTYTFSVRVTDNGSPVLYDEEQISVSVSNPVTTGPLSPIADANTRSGAYANDNYGSLSTLTVKGTTSVDYNRATYLKFSLNGVSTVGSAVLRLYGNNTENTATITLVAYGVNNDSWQESTVTWNTAPTASTSALSSVGVSSQPRYYEFDVTSYVQAQLSGDKIVSLLIKDPNNQNKACVFNSRENAANPPELQLSETPLNHPPVLASIGNKTTTVGQALTFTASATDPDAGQTLTFSLINAPDGATVNASTGTFSWTPSTAGSYTFTVRVSDNGSPVLTDDEQITVTVNDITTTNLAPNAPSSPSPTNGGSSMYSNTSLCVTASDPDNTTLRVRFYGRKKVTYNKFTMVLIPDPQYYVAEPQGTKGGYTTMFKSQTQWIADNRVTKNIKFVGGLGDCVEHGDTFDVEWRRVDTVMRTIEDAGKTGLFEGIPYGLCVGNHDQSPRGDPNGTTNLYNKYFGTARLSSRSYYGGHNGSNNDNHYELFSASGIDFLVLCPEYDMTSGFTAPGGTLDWMVSIINQYPTRKIIVVSHYVIDLSANFTTQGAAIYNRLKSNPNFILMVGGHIASSTGAGEAQRTDTYNGNVVNTITQDYQMRTNGGNGLLRTYEFNPQNNTCYIQTYSPYTNTYETDANSQFTINTNLSVTPEAYSLIGEMNNVTSGSNVCASWPSLMDNSTYEWYAEVYDGTNTTVGPIWSFTTNSGTLTSTSLSAQSLKPISEENATVHGLSIYPNPNNTHHITVTLPLEIKGNVRVEIVDMTGTVQVRKDFKDVSRSFSMEHHLAAGQYMVVVKSKGTQLSKKLIVLE